MRDEHRRRKDRKGEKADMTRNSTWPALFTAHLWRTSCSQIGRKNWFRCPFQSVKRTFQNAQAPRHRRRAGHTQREAPWRAGHGTTTQGRARRHTLNTGRDNGAHSPRQQGQRAPPKESLHHVQCCRPTHSPSPARARPRAASITHRTHSHALQ